MWLSKHYYLMVRLHNIFSKILLAGILILGLSACGIYSFTGASIPPQASTISVDYFPNNAQLIEPTLSQVFTEALQDKFLQQTNLRLVEERGHLHFEGSITGYTTQPTAITGTDQAALNRLTISVRVIYFSEFEPGNEFERVFSRFYDYPSNLSLSAVEDQAITTIVEALVEDIFNTAVVNW